MFVPGVGAGVGRVLRRKWDFDRRKRQHCHGLQGGGRGLPHLFHRLFQGRFQSFRAFSHCEREISRENLKRLADLGGELSCFSLELTECGVGLTWKLFGADFVRELELENAGRVPADDAHGRNRNSLPPRLQRHLLAGYSRYLAIRFRRYLLPTQAT